LLKNKFKVRQKGTILINEERKVYENVGLINPPIDLLTVIAIIAVGVHKNNIITLIKSFIIKSEK